MMRKKQVDFKLQCWVTKSKRDPEQTTNFYLHTAKSNAFLKK